MYLQTCRRSFRQRGTRAAARRAASVANESLKSNGGEAHQRHGEIDARVNDFPYARKRPRLSYAKISNINLRDARVYTRAGVDAREVVYASVERFRMRAPARRVLE